MCGFFGAVRCDGGPVKAALLERAASRLRHRGPDDEGYLLGDPVSGETWAGSGRDTMPGVRLPHVASAPDSPWSLGLAFRRLAIQDPGPAGHQPMRSADGLSWVVFNGEIYNHLDLRRELEARGARFHGRSDTETLLAAYRAWGDDFVHRLEGMWAFALWDVPGRRLLLSRDRFGIKPLYLADARGVFVFASEIRPLLDVGGVPREAHPRRLFDYLRFGTTDDGGETLFAGVHQLPPAHSMAVDLTGAARRDLVRHWSPPLETPSISSPEAAERVRDTFLASVRLHLLSDIPVGITLSGGLDSTAIACAARQHLGPDHEMHAFGHVVDHPTLGEERWIRIAAEAAGARMHSVRPQPSELLGDLERLVEAQELPFGSTSIYAQYRVFRLASETGIHVTLGGQGADELLAGYRSYLGPRLATLVRRGRLLGALRLLRGAARAPGADLRGLLLRAGSDFVPSSLERLARRLGGETLVPAWLDESWFSREGIEPRGPRPPQGQDRLRAHLRRALTESSLPMLLRYEDRNSMAWSVESRVPFLYTPLVESILALPESELIDAHGTSKAVFRRAMRGRMPDATLDRRDKVGFATPERDWLGTLDAAIQVLLSAPENHEIRGLRSGRLLEEWRAICAGRAPFDSRIWRGINLIAWARRFQVGFPA